MGRKAEQTPRTDRRLSNPRAGQARTPLAPCAMPRFALLLVALLLLASAADAAPGDVGTKFKVDDGNPVSSVPTQREKNTYPIEFAHWLQDLIARAEGAFAKHEWAKSAKYYEALAVAVPDRAIAFSKLCAAYGKLDKVDLAAKNCAVALRLGGAKVIDHVRFINLTLRRKELEPADIEEVEASLAHLRDHAEKHPQPLPSKTKHESAKAAKPGPPYDPSHDTRSKEQIEKDFLRARMKQAVAKAAEGKGKVEHERKPQLNDMHLATEIEFLDCKLATRLRDAERLTQCMNALKKLQVEEELLLPFAWAQALILKDDVSAGRLFAKAKELGLPEETLGAMATEQEKAFASAGMLGSLGSWGKGALALVVVAGLLAGLAFVVRRRRATVVEPSVAPSRG